MIVYILYSSKLNRFYTGQTSLSAEERLEEHNSKFYKNSFTAKGIPWNIFLVIRCQSKFQAISIEQHIKRMKSKKYICNLQKYPEMQDKLLDLYSVP
jgi:putative endonuclease